MPIYKKPTLFKPLEKALYKGDNVLILSRVTLGIYMILHKGQEKKCCVINLRKTRSTSGSINNTI